MVWTWAPGETKTPAAQGPANGPEKPQGQQRGQRSWLYCQAAAVIYRHWDCSPHQPGWRVREERKAPSRRHHPSAVRPGAGEKVLGHSSAREHPTTLPQGGGFRSGLSPVPAEHEAWQKLCIGFCVPAEQEGRRWPDPYANHHLEDLQTSPLLSDFFLSTLLPSNWLSFLDKLLLPLLSLLISKMGTTAPTWGGGRTLVKGTPRSLPGKVFPPPVFP